MSIQPSGALLEGCVLAVLAQGDTYGYNLTKRVKDTLEVSESTLYPVMRRLQTDDCLTAYDVPHNGRNRRYYKITERGKLRYSETVENWHLFKIKIDEFLRGEK